MFADFILSRKGLLAPKNHQVEGEGGDKVMESSNDPAVRLAFASKLDTETRGIQDRQVSI